MIKLQSGLWPLIVQMNLPAFEIDARNPAAQHAGPFKACSQGSSNMGGIQAARGNFNKHRREQPEFFSLIMVKETVGSPRNCFSSCSVVVTPAKPPPRITTWVAFSGRKIARAGDSAPRKYLASSRTA